MSPETNVSRRLVKDHLVNYKLAPSKVEIDNKMMFAVKNARTRYEVHLEEEKKVREKCLVESAAKKAKVKVKEALEKVDRDI